jgi:hypothetical protein
VQNTGSLRPSAHDGERSSVLLGCYGQPVRETLDRLDVFVGEWRMIASFTPDPVDAPRARTSFEWLPGRRFLIQRWEVEHPDAPDGIAIIGVDAGGTRLLQHYFDSRGVARVYQMTFADRVWTLERFAAAPDFCQRFAGTFSDDGDTIAGNWERSSGSDHWAPDFSLTYTRLR